MESVFCGAYLTCSLHGFFILTFKTCEHFGLENPRQADERQEARDYQS